MWGDETEGLSFPYLSNLVFELPAESQTARRLGVPIAGMPGQWGNAEELLAGVIEVLGDFRNVYIKSRPRKRGSPSPTVTPIKIQRPKGRDGQDRERPKPAGAAELAAFLGAHGVQIDYTPPAEEGR